MKRSWLRPLAGGVVVLAIVTLPIGRAGAQQFSRSHWNTPNGNGQTSTDGVFAGTFQNWPTDTVKLTLTTAQPPDHCQPTTTASVDYTNTASPTGTRDFSFAQGDAICNGVYTATAEAQQKTPPRGDLRTVETLTLNNITVAVPAKPASNIKATPTDGGSVQLSWSSGYGDTPAPPDFAGYQLYRVDRSNNREQILAHPIEATSYVDVDVPATGAYSYEVDAIRNNADPAGAQSDVVNVFVPASSSSSGAQAGQQSSGVAGATGGSGSANTAAGQSGQAQQAQDGPRSRYFATGPTLAGDEPGGDQQAANLPSAGSVSIGRDDGPPGAGLAKPAAAALVAAMWAGLLLFLSRRAKHVTRPELQAPVELEHVP